MIRDVSRLASVEFDLLVIGGGIYGLAAAYDAAQRGLTVALVERSDFGSATSFNHLKTIHGGLRYLQTADLRRMRESVRERRAFARIAPRFVAPLAFLTPTSSTPTRNPLAMRAAFAIDAIVGFDRNQGLPSSLNLPAGRIVSSDESRALCGADGEGPIGPGAMWYDYQTVEGDRLTLAFALAADAAGAVLANYVEAAEAVRSGGTVTAVRARDVLSNTSFDIRARMVVNAAGPWAAVLLSRAGVDSSWPLMKAMNLVTTRAGRKAALVKRTASGRALILLPWRGRTLVGTSESAETYQPESQEVTRPELARFVEEVNATFPGFGLSEGEVSLVHRGIVPAVRNGAGLSLLGHSRVLDHAADGISNLVSIVGVKYTTARATAERLVDLVLAKLGRPVVPCRTAEVPLPTASLGEALPADPIRHAVEMEMAHTLADVVLRRTGLGAAGYPGDAAVAECANAMQQIVGWSTERRDSEVAAVKPFYLIT